MKIAVCDDNPATANYIEEYLSSLPLRGISCDVFSSGAELLSYMKTNRSESGFDIYFMDIEMPGIDGIKTSEQIRETDKKALIIFITEHREYVYDVFEVLPFRFIVKPVTEEKLSKAFYDAIDTFQTMKRLFFFKIEKNRYSVTFEDIQYFESSGRKITLITGTERFEFYDKISNIIGSLDENIFLQIHASYIINMEFIRLITDTEVTLAGGTVLPISKKFRKDVKTRHLNFIEWKCGR